MASSRVKSRGLARQGLKRTIAAVWLALLVAPALPTTSAQGTEPAEGPAAVPFASVGGHVQAIEVGSVIARGQEIVQGGSQTSASGTEETCSFSDPISVGANVPDGGQPLEIVSRVQPDCSMVITSITPISAASEPLPSGSGGVVVPAAPETSSLIPDTTYVLEGTGHRAYLGWVKGIVQEQFGITSTERYSEFRYLEDSAGRPQRPHAWDGYCYHSAFPGYWTIENCYYRHQDQAPAMQFLEAWGDYRYNSAPPPNPGFRFKWRHFLQFNGSTIWFGGSGYQYSCALRNSTGLPPSWDHRCRGGRDRIA